MFLKSAMLFTLLFYTAINADGSAPYGTHKILGSNDYEVNQHPIYQAIDRGDFIEAKRLVSSGVSPNQPSIPSIVFNDSKLRYTPLYPLINCRNNDECSVKLDMARYLLEHGANPNATWNDGHYGTNPLVELLSGYEPGDSYKIEYRNKMVMLLLQKGANPNQVSPHWGSSFKIVADKIQDNILNSKDYSGLLNIAIEMIKHGADSSYLIKLLMESHYIQSKDALAVLIKNGVKLTDVSFFYDLVDHNEGGKNNKKIELYIKNGFDVNSKLRGEPLIRTLESNEDAVKLMLKLGAKFEDMSDSYQEKYKKINPDNSIADKTGFLISDLMALLFSAAGLGLVVIIAIGIFAFFRYKSWKKAQIREKNRAELSKAKMDANSLLSMLDAIDIEFLPEEKNEAQILSDKIKALVKELDIHSGKEESFAKKHFRKSFSSLEKAVSDFANSVQTKREETADEKQ